MKDKIEKAYRRLTGKKPKKKFPQLESLEEIKRFMSQRPNPTRRD